MVGFDTWCGEIPELNEAKINQNYKDMETIEKKLESEFRTKMLWKVRYGYIACIIAAQV